MKKKVLEFPLGTYKGDIKSNLPHGKGVMKFKTGDIYEGSFLKGLRHGKHTNARTTRHLATAAVASVFCTALKWSVRAGSAVGTAGPRSRWQCTWLQNCSLCASPGENPGDATRTRSVRSAIIVESNASPCLRCVACLL